jgi:hypothetical protein
MNLKPTQRPMRRAAADVVLGLALFLAFAFGLIGARLDDASHGQANAAELARVAAFTGPMGAKSATVTVAAKPAILLTTGTPAASGQTSAMLLLAAVFAVLFAFNLAFFRHLRRVYAAPGRRRPPRNCR